MKVAQWVQDMRTEEADPPVLAEKEDLGKGQTASDDAWSHIYSAFQLLEGPGEGNEVEFDTVDRQDSQTQIPANQVQVSSTSVSVEERPGDNEAVTSGLVAENLKETVVDADETTGVKVQAESPDVQAPNKSQSIDVNLDEIDKVSRGDIDINLEVLNKASKVVIDINVDVLDKAPTNSPQRLGEYVVEEDFKFEEHSEAEVDTAATKAKEIPFTEVIQVKEDDDTGEVEMKIEVEPNNEKRRKRPEQKLAGRSYQPT